MTRPRSGSISRLIMRSVVVLPHPDGPMRTQVSPSGISSDRSRTALEPDANCLVTFSRRITARLPYRNERAAIPGHAAVGRLGMALHARPVRVGGGAAARRADCDRGGRGLGPCTAFGYPRPSLARIETSSAGRVRRVLHDPLD